MSSTNGSREELKDNNFILEMERAEAHGSDTSTPDNLLGKDLQSVLKPINIMHALFVCAKYKIRDSKISTNSTLYNVVSFVATVTFLCGSFYSILGTFTIHGNGFECLLQFSKVYTYFLYIMGSFLNYFTNIVQKQNNVVFVMKIQYVFRLLKINDSFKRFIFPNWVCVITLNCFHIAWMFYSYYIFTQMGFGNIFTSYCFISIDMNILYATRIMKLMTKPLKSWVQSVQISEHVANSDIEEYWNTMFEVFIEILQAYKIFTKTFHQLILFYIIHTTSKSLISIALRIEMRKVMTGSENNILYALHSFISLTWIIKNMLLIIFLCVENEKFYSAMREAQSTCIQLTKSSGCSDIKKRVCKNIQRVQIAHFRKMYACGLFSIDAELPLNLCALITTYTIVLLQFEFL